MWNCTTSDKRIHFFETHNSNKTIAAAEAPQQSYTMTAAVTVVTSLTTPPQHNPAITITTKFTLPTWRQEAGKASSLQQQWRGYYCSSDSDSWTVPAPMPTPTPTPHNTWVRHTPLSHKNTPHASVQFHRKLRRGLEYFANSTNHTDNNLYKNRHRRQNWRSPKQIRKQPRQYDYTDMKMFRVKGMV